MMQTDKTPRRKKNLAASTDDVPTETGRAAKKRAAELIAKPVQIVKQVNQR